MFFRSLGFKAPNVDLSILIYQKNNNEIIYITLINFYVDKFLLMGKD